MNNKIKVLRLALILILISTVFLSSSSFTLAEVPAPEKVLGFRVGQDFKLASWKQISEYFRLLDEASERVKVVELGKTTLGRPLIMAIITSADNMNRLDDYKKIHQRLHDPRGLSPEEKSNLIKQGKAVVYISCSIHSTEIAASQMSMELAHRLASENTPEIQKILDEVILLLVPSANPDGIDLVTDWYYRNLGTAYEASSMPWLYHYYAGHDNNRDWFMLTQKETRLMVKVLYQEWFPLLVYDIHQMVQNGPRLFLPPYQDPINPNLDPLLLRELYNLTGEAAINLTREGKTGVATSTIFDGWYNSANRAAPLRHNALGILSEAASCNLASPLFLRSSDIRVSGGGNEIQSTYLEPWPGGWWHLRDIVEYEEIVALSFLKTVAEQREKFLENFCSFAERQINKGLIAPPFAYLIPRDQKDLPAALKLIEVIQKNGAEVYQAKNPFTADGLSCAAGTYVIPLAQPYRAFIKDLLEAKAYPLPPGKDPAEYLPYDEASWTLPLQMGVKVVEVTNRFEASLNLLTPVQLPDSSFSEEGGKYYLVDSGTNNSVILTNRLSRKGIRFSFVDRDFNSKGRTFRAGSIVIEKQIVNRSELASLSKGLGLTIEGVNEVSPAKLQPFLPHRLAIYQPFTVSMEEGWTRWVLEQFEFPYQVIHNSEIRAGQLQKSYTHIIIPGISTRVILEGRKKGEAPPAYTGGIGLEGVAALNSFVKNGGILIALENSADFAIDYFGLPVKNIIEPVRRGREENQAGADSQTDRIKIYSPGSILRVRINNSRPETYGLDDEANIFSFFSPAFELKKPEEEKVPGIEKIWNLAWYPPYNPLLSGILLNGDKLQDKSAAVSCQMGKGKVVLLGFDVIHRAQAHGSFKFLFNPIVYR
jgi:hypothetical protein